MENPSNKEEKKTTGASQQYFTISGWGYKRAGIYNVWLISGGGLQDVFIVVLT